MIGVRVFADDHPRQYVQVIEKKMRVNLAFHQLYLRLRAHLAQLLRFGPMPFIFLEKKEYGMQKVEKQVHKSRINNIQLEGVQILLPGIVVKYMAHQAYYTQGSRHGNSHTREEEAYEE